MEFIPTNPILEFNPDQLKTIRKQYNLDKPGDMSRAIDVLEAWIKMQKHFMKKDFSRIYLEKIILAGKGSLERAKQRLDKICTFRTAMPNFFGENSTNSSFEEFKHVFRCVVLPKVTSENYRVIMLKAFGSTFTNDLLMDCYKFLVIILEYLMAYDYCDGIIAILDYTDADLIELVKALTLTELQQILTIITEGFVLRLKEINVLTTSAAAHTFVGIIKQLVSSKIRKRIYIHRDISTVYQSVPKYILPVEYGGKEMPLIELNEKIKTEFSGDFKHYLEEMNKAKTDESCRDIGAYNEQYLGTPGSFRTLNVD